MKFFRAFLMKHLYQIAIGAILVTTLVALVTMNSLRLRLDRGMDGSSTIAEAGYHFVLIAEQIDSPYWQEVYAGARAAAAEVGAAVELAGSENFSIDQSAEQIEIATAARLDGIATCVVDTEKTGKAINAAIAQGIPVVTLEYDASNSQRQCFVGVNSYDLGQSFGRIVAGRKTTGKAVILVGDDPHSTTLSENQIVAGLSDYLARYPGISLSSLEISRTSAFAAEKSIRSLLVDNQTAGSTIISLNVEDTLRVVEVMLDYGQSNLFDVVGYQENSDVLDYIKSGLIQSVIASDPYQIGYDSIKALAELKSTQRTSDYIPSRLVTINQQNVDSYIKSASSKGKQP